MLTREELTEIRDEYAHADHPIAGLSYLAWAAASTALELMNTATGSGPALCTKTPGCPNADRHRGRCPNVKEPDESS